MGQPVNDQESKYDGIEKFEIDPILTVLTEKKEPKKEPKKKSKTGMSFLKSDRLA